MKIENMAEWLKKNENRLFRQDKARERLGLLLDENNKDNEIYKKYWLENQKKCDHFELNEKIDENTFYYINGHHLLVPRRFVWELFRAFKKNMLKRKKLNEWEIELFAKIDSIVCNK